MVMQFCHSGCICICLSALSTSSPEKKKLRRGGGPSGRQRASSLFLVFSLPVSSKYPCIPEPEFGNACVCTDPPPPSCMYEGLPPHTHKWRGGSLHTHAFPNSGIRNARVLSLSHILIIYMYIYIYGALLCALRSVLVLGIPEASKEAVIRRRPP